MLVMEMTMWIQNFLKSLTSTSTRQRTIRRRPSAARLSLEALEEPLGAELFGH